jgi:hypothetical protein
MKVRRLIDWDSSFVMGCVFGEERTPTERGAPALHSQLE